MNRLVAVTRVVGDWDEAIAHSTQVPDFALLGHTDLGAGKLRVRVGPRGDGGMALLLARASGERQQAAVGNQTDGRVAFFQQTDALARDPAAMKARGVEFRETPRDEVHGEVVVLEDLQGSRRDFLRPVA